MYKFLRIFDPNGNDSNFEFSDELNRYVGTFYIPRVSTGLVENFQFYLMEHLQTGPTASPILGFPWIQGLTGTTGYTGGSDISFYWEDDQVEEFFMFQFSGTASNPVIQKFDAGMTASFDYDVNGYTNPGTSYGATAYSGMTIVPGPTFIRSTPLQINIGFLPEYGGEYQRKLFIKDVFRDLIIAEIDFYSEAIEEDERLDIMLNNFGFNINAQDFKIFQTTDINESMPDFIKLNEKRKELLLEFHNIFPYLGSYKALINIIKYFGYENIQIKEYWKNIDVESANFGKYRHANIEDFFSPNAKFNTSSNLIPSKIYKKTSKFGMFYQITEETGQYDDDGIPIVEETFDFTMEEILIKLYGLKEKLKKYFLPLNARIVDIIGELTFYSKYDINTWNDQTRIDSININIKPEYSVLPSTYGHIQDLRSLEFIGCPIAPDLTLGATYSLHVYDWEPWNVYLSNVYRIRDTITNNWIGFTAIGNNIYDVVDGLVLAWQNSPDVPFRQFQAMKLYELGMTGMTGPVMRTVQLVEIPHSFVAECIIGASSATPPGMTQTSVYIGTTATQFYSNCFLGFFNDWNRNVLELNDAEGIPVGYPAILQNDSFKLTWDDAEVTWNSLDEYGITGPQSCLNTTIFSGYTGSIIGITNVGGTGPSQSYVGIPNPLWPSYFPNFTFRWDNIEHYNYYQMRWVVSKDEDETPSFYHDSGASGIDAYYQYPVILPYTGKYNVDLYLYDLNNNVSTRFTKEFIEVDMDEVDFIGYYTKLDPPYTMDQDIQIGNYASTWDLPFNHITIMDDIKISFNMLDKIEFYQLQDDNTVVPQLTELHSYKWNNLGYEATWNDLSHLWWEGIGNKMTKFDITSVYGSVSNVIPNTIIMVHENTSHNNVYVFLDELHFNMMSSFNYNDIAKIVGGTGITGTYRYDGISWKDENMIIDHYQFQNVTGNTESDFIEAVRQLNETVCGATMSYPLLSKFIYYYNNELSSGTFTPIIYAISKEYDKPGRFKLFTQGAVASYETFETVNFGTVGDIPSFFEIYQIGPSGGTIQIDDFPAYTLQSTGLTAATIELNGATAEGVNKFLYNIVLGGTAQIPVKINAVRKDFKSYPDLHVVFGPTAGNIIGVTYGRNITSNVTLDQIRILNTGTVLPILTQVHFFYDNCGIHGKINPQWEIIKEDDADWVNIYYNKPYFAYLFNQAGSYSIKLTIEDTNGNSKTVIKNEFIKIE